MIHRPLYRAQVADAVFLLALSGAAYHHTGEAWLLYAIYIAASMTFFGTLRDVSTWLSCIGDAITFHARCIRDKHFDVNVNHRGRIEGK